MPRKLVGILCVIATVTFFSIQDMAVKWLSTDYALHQIIFIRSLIGLAVTLGFLLPIEGGYEQLISKRFKLLLVRSGTMIFTNIFIFCALAALPMANAMAIFFTGPLIITILSVPVLGERIGVQRLLAVFVGLLGAILIIRPGGDTFQVASLLPLGAAICYSAMVLMTRKLGVTESASTMVFYLHFIFLIASITMGLAAGDGKYVGSSHPATEFLLRAWIWPDLNGWMFLSLIGVTFAAGGYFVSKAYKSAEASFLAPFEYVSIPMAVFWSFLVWDELPDKIAAIGIGLIISAGLFVAFRESRNKDIRTEHQTN